MEPKIYRDLSALANQNTLVVVPDSDLHSGQGLSQKASALKIAVLLCVLR